MYSAFIFFGGLADLFLSVMLWFILDSEKTASFQIDGDRVYAVTDVVQLDDSSINVNCLDESDKQRSDRASSYFSNSSNSISKQMIKQFFTEVEDHSWHQDEVNY